MLFNLLYTTILIEESSVNIQESSETNKNFLSDFFDTTHVAETFKVAFKKDENKRRMKILMVLMIAMVLVGPMSGEMSVTYLFTRYKFNWSEVEFSIFSTYSMVLSFIGTLFAVSFLSRKLKIDDCVSEK